MFGKDKISQSMIDAVKQVLGEGRADDLKDKKEAEKEADWWGDKEKTKKQEKPKARFVAGKSDSGAKRKEDDEDMNEEKDCVSEPEAKHIAKGEVKKHEKKMHKEDFASRLIASAHENELIESEINEVLSKDASAGDWIHDFVHSDNPKFKGKSKAMRKKMALAAYYAKQRNEETDLGTHPHDKEDEKEDEKLIKKMVKKSALKSDECYEKPAYLRKSMKSEEIDSNVRTKDMLRGRKSTNQKDDVGPGSDHKPTKVKFSGGPMTTKEEVEIDESTGVTDYEGKHQGGNRKELLSLYAKTKDSKHAESARKAGASQGELKAAHSQKNEDVEFYESKRPETDNVPFEGPYNTTSEPVKTDKSGAKHTPMSRAKHLARTAMKRIKTEMLGKAPGNN